MGIFQNESPALLPVPPDCRSQTLLLRLAPCARQPPELSATNPERVRKYCLLIQCHPARSVITVLTTACCSSFYPCSVSSRQWSRMNSSESVSTLELVFAAQYSHLTISTRIHSQVLSQLLTRDELRTYGTSPFPDDSARVATRDGNGACPLVIVSSRGVRVFNQRVVTHGMQPAHATRI